MIFCWQLAVGSWRLTQQHYIVAVRSFKFQLKETQIRDCCWLLVVCCWGQTTDNKQLTTVSAQKSVQ